MSNDKAATILYIEDDPASRRLVQRILDSRGYDVHVAGDGLEGISLARETRAQSHFNGYEPAQHGWS